MAYFPAPIFVLLLVLAACVSPKALDQKNEGLEKAAAEFRPSENILACGEEVVLAIQESRKTSAEACDWNLVDSLATAREVQAVAISVLSETAPVIGYKITRVPDGPVVGTILDGMLLPSGSRLNFNQAATMFPEADMLVRISDAAINDTHTTQEAVAYIDRVYPYIEISNPITWEGVGRAQIPWTATNGSVRWGVFGEPIAVDLSDPDTRAQFDQMRVTLTKPNGEVFSDIVLERSLLENLPVLVGELRARGLRLSAGDVISLGNYGRPIVENVAEGTYTVTYSGFTESPVSVSVTLVR